MITDGMLCTGGPLLAVESSVEPSIAQYGIVAVIAWLVIREAFAVVRYCVDRRARKVNGGCSDHDLLIKMRAQLEALRDRVDRMEG